jgi:hypothetical protein
MLEEPAQGRRKLENAAPPLLFHTSELSEELHPQLYTWDHTQG